MRNLAQRIMIVIGLSLITGCGVSDSNGDPDARTEPIARSVYTVDMRIANAGGGLDALEFGQREEPFAEQAPPPPPEGALHAYFYYNGNELFKDYRSDVETAAVWELHYQAADGENLVLDWQVDVINMEGELILTDPDATLDVDMQNVSSLEFLNGEYRYFLIVYQN